MTTKDSILFREDFMQAISVFGAPGRFVRSTFMLLWLGILLLVLFSTGLEALPYPSEVFAALGRLWRGQGGSNLVYNVYVTLKLNVVGLILPSIISLLIAYVSVFAAFRPFNKMVQWLRYIPIVGFNLVFLSLFAIGWSMKVAMLTTGMTFFLVTSMTAVVASIPRMKYELARVLGYNDWQVFYTVVARPYFAAYARHDRAERGYRSG
ncbi:MAG: hypothetical protein WKF84_10895 [Pyrinomonadaceae bacterium]